MGKFQGVYVRGCATVRRKQKTMNESDPTGENSKQHHELLNSLAPRGGKRWQALDVTTTQHFMLYLVSSCVVLSNLLRRSEEMKLWLSTCLCGTSEPTTQKHLFNPSFGSTKAGSMLKKHPNQGHTSTVDAEPCEITFGLVEWCWNPPPWFRGFLSWVTTFLRGKAKVKGCAKCDKHQFDVITSN